MSLKDFIDSNYKTACEIQRNISKDFDMQSMLRSGVVDNILVTSWMLNYALFQGINAADRSLIVNKYAELVFQVANPSTSPSPTEAEIESMFRSFLTNFYNTVPRKWLSASSKLLWCSFPDSVVIYDAFVERALVVLQGISPCLAKMPRIKSCPKIKSIEDIDGVVAFYINYRNMVKAILAEHQDLLKKLREMHNESYPHDIRIVDKLLWMLGNPNQSLS